MKEDRRSHRRNFCSCKNNFLKQERKDWFPKQESPKDDFNWDANFPGGWGGCTLRQVSHSKQETLSVTFTHTSPNLFTPPKIV